MKLKNKKLGIQTQILFGFLIFTIIIVALLWFFQIGLLNNFYKAIKYNEVEKTANSISENANDLQNIKTLNSLREITENTGTNIMITDGNGNPLVRVTTGYSNDFFDLSSNLLGQLFDRISLEGNEYIEWNEDLQELIYIKIHSDMSKDKARMIILNTSVVPVDATLDTLKIQLMCLTIVMIILSAVLALMLARKISKPIKNINEGAKKLALGDYGTKLDLKGSLETYELANTLNYTATELANVENLRRELIANVSHDLRTPLTMISGYAEVMRDIPGENSPENIQVIIDESERLTKLVNDLLDLSKFESGKSNYNPAIMNLTESIRGILTRYDKLADYNFDFYHGEDIYVYGDELKISQVIYNLVNNAINYTGEDKYVTLMQHIDNSKVIIEVSDTGQGIESDKLKDIWERYYKLDKEHKRAQVGTGLGLSIVKKVIELHGGECGVSSVVGQGSTFWFSLPIAENQENI